MCSLRLRGAKGDSRARAPLGRAARFRQLLNVFYYRETLFIVYELLRDNLCTSLRP